MRPVDRPQAPSSHRHPPAAAASRAAPPAVGARRAKPIAATRSVPWPTSWIDVERDAAVGRSARRYSPHRAPREVHARRACGARSRAGRRRNSSATGAGEKPQLPTTSVVTPWRIFDSARRLPQRRQSECECMSMKPGATHVARGVQRCGRPARGERSPTAAMLSPWIADVGADGRRARCRRDLPALDLEVKHRLRRRRREAEDALAPGRRAEQPRLAPPARPTSWMASGRPWASSPLGSEMAGTPGVAPRRAERGVAGRAEPAGAGPGAVGRQQRVERAATGVISSRNRRRAAWASRNVDAGDRAPQLDRLLEARRRSGRAWRAKSSRWNAAASTRSTRCPRSWSPAKEGGSVTSTTSAPARASAARRGLHVGRGLRRRARDEGPRRRSAAGPDRAGRRAKSSTGIGLDSGSLASWPAMTPSASAASSTERARRPDVIEDHASGTTPVGGMRPCVALKPTTPQ